MKEQAILQSIDVDDHLGLQLWSRGAVPRLVIYNKGKDSGKTVRFSWLEGENKSISLKRKDGKIEKYSLAQLLPVIQELLSTEAAIVPFKMLVWKTALLFSDYLHEPKVLISREDRALLSEEKRQSLWLADMEEQIFSPSFPLAKEEAHLEEKIEGIHIGDDRSVVALRAKGITRQLASCNPERWYRHLYFSAVALLLGFSLSEEVASELSDHLWQRPTTTDGDVWGSLRQPALIAKEMSLPLLSFQQKIKAFTRHWEVVQNITREENYDSVDFLLKQGYKRKRRVDFPQKALGDVPYTVTICENVEDDLIAFCLKPLMATARHKEERMYKVSLSNFEKALGHDSAGSSQDEFFTIASLVKATDFSFWLKNVRQIVEPVLSSPL
ncbi:MAG: hypothetical protein WCQ97_02575 [Aminobacterium sp.]|jgi:hypothetical protein|uniref:hypothetical protein n=1 Tax=Aminobacterium sp. TaxID=1872491 RepID=UPI001BCAA21D|nr:hypothetical protein [Aminobacterium sp.]MDD2206019.1 hypothetical protein [Aminobacterium sp.]MDD3425746.1 hypothetical protein [Aminobacterium sp.]MDD3707196.1 hypothetical protein [Aminobacterium sp.]MDD4227824.1 hypothetical protein [Aminobacterium sp.]MDD4550736.1 hypothetical protein [Aminobacterium sp.]